MISSNAQAQPVGTRASSVSAPIQNAIDSALTLSVPVLLSRVLVAIALIAQIVIALRFWPLVWDDAAITLGFSRTFALTGRIEPTPGSGIVEGYSTTLWMLLMALAAKLSSNPTTLLAIAKISSLLLNLANIVLIRRWFLTWTPETCANLIAGSVGCGLMFYETINGMETPLILTLILVMLLLQPSQSRVARICYLIAGSAFLLTRWEAAWLLIPFVLVEKTTRRALVSSATWLSILILSNLIRWFYFGSLLPNTIVAKRGIPYSASLHDLEVVRHLHEPAYILASCKVLLLFLFTAFIYDRFVLRKHDSLLERFRKSLRKYWQLRFTVLFVLFSLVLSTIIGTNWGPEYRSFYSAWPFLFCLFLLPVVYSFRPRALPWITACVCLFALVRMSVRIDELHSKNAPLYMPEATVAKVAHTDDLLMQVKSAAHRNTLLFAGPDMGGIILYAYGIQVIDLGLLCDPVLARERYAAIDSYVLQQRQPDVIEVHQLWTTLTNFHNSPLFRSRYRPVYVDGKRLFLSRSLIADINPSHLIEKSFDATGHSSDPEIARSNSDYRAVDFALNKDFGTYLILE
ncbi:MAG TPA: hypothetical protein VNU92_01245 [Edaphobacter sp.]|jgi:hypothetical protein|nr:hypothetical protein [Edaphobacter sp.]